MSREDRIRLYKRIRNKYLNNAADLPPEEKLAALESGYLLGAYEHFDSHNQAIEAAKKRIAVIDKQEIADAFLYSLSSSLCEYRSPLLSYYYIQSIEPHEFDDSRTIMEIETHSGYCNTCRYNTHKDNFVSVNFALIEKYLCGSVSWFAYYLDSSIMDITQYLTMSKAESSDCGRAILFEALNLIKSLNPSDKAGAYIKRLYEAKIIPNSTKDQIVTFVETLGSLNILHRAGDYAMTKGISAYNQSYRDPSEHKNDHPFPLTHWRAADGFDGDEVQRIFNMTVY